MQSQFDLEYCEFMRKFEACSSNLLTFPIPDQTSKSVLNSPYQSPITCSSELSRVTNF